MKRAFAALIAAVLFFGAPGLPMDEACAQQWRAPVSGAAPAFGGEAGAAGGAFDPGLANDALSDYYLNLRGAAVPSLSDAPAALETAPPAPDFSPEPGPGLKEGPEPGAAGERSASDIERPRTRIRVLPGSAPVRAESAGAQPQAAKGGELEEGRTLVEGLSRFGRYWGSKSQQVGGLSTEQLAAEGDNFRKLLHERTAGGASAASVVGPERPGLARPTLQALPETGEGRLAAGAAQAPAPSAPEDRPSGRSPPGEPFRVPSPRSAGLAYAASIVTASLGGAAFAAPLFALHPALGAAAAADFVLHTGAAVVYSRLGGSSEKLRESGELHSIADVEAQAAEPKNRIHAAAFERTLKGLRRADRIMAGLVVKLGLPPERAPLVGLYQPEQQSGETRANLVAEGVHGVSPKSVVGLGEWAAGAWMEKDWRVPAGAMAHELGHHYYGDLKAYDLLKQWTGSVYACCGLGELVRRLIKRRLFRGEKPGGRWGLAAAGLGAALAKALAVPASAAVLAWVPAGFALIVVSALARQAYRRSIERRADLFAAALTHPDWLAAYLRSGPNFNASQGPATWFQRLRSSHPSIPERLEALERTSSALKNSP